MRVGFSVILDTKNEGGVQKLAGNSLKVLEKKMQAYFNEKE